MSKNILAGILGDLILVGDWKNGHRLYAFDGAETKEILAFGGTEEVEGKKKRKLSPEEFFTKIKGEVKLPLNGKKVFMVMLQPNIIVSSLFIKLGAKVFGMPSFLGKCKGIDGQLELVTNTLRCDDSDVRFAELTAARLGASGIAELCSSLEDLVKIRIALNDRIFIDDMVRQSMETVGLDQVTSKRLARGNVDIISLLNDSVIKAEKQVRYQREKILSKNPVYKEVFEPVYQIGQSLAAKLMKEIVTMSRFATKEKLVAYFGLHVKNGKAPKRKKSAPGEKKETANWNTNGKTALYLWAEQLMKGKGKRPDDPYVVRLLHYYEIYCSRIGVEIPGKETIQNKRHAFYCAYRQVAKKLLHHIYRDWKRVEGESSAVKTDGEESQPITESVSANKASA